MTNEQHEWDDDRDEHERVEDSDREWGRHDVTLLTLW